MNSDKSNKTTLKKGDNLPPRGKAKKTLMLDAIRSVCKGGEQEFLEKLVTIGLGDVKKEIPPNPALLTLVINRIEPPLKSISPMVEFDFDSNDKPHVKADKILQAVSIGKLPPDIGQMFMASIKSMIDIEEYTDLKERIERLEKVIDGTA